jgi:Bacterial SH3 domain
MEMIDATALENRRARESDRVGATADGRHRRSGHAPDTCDTMQGARRAEGNAVLAPNHRWRIQRLALCIAGLIAVSAIGGLILGSEVAPPPVVADHVLKARSGLVGTAYTTDEPARPPLPAGEPGGLQATAAEGSPTAAGENGTAGEQTSTEVVRSGAIAPVTTPTSEQQAPPEASSSPPLSDETGSTSDRARDPVPIRVARVISGVNMRAGPSNGQAVVGTIPGGSTVDVISCRAWCEVIFAGQRGWVYKGFIAP